MRIFQYLGSHEIYLMDDTQSIKVNQGDEVVADGALAAGLEHRSDFAEVQPKPKPALPAPTPTAQPEVQSTPTN